MAEVAFRKIHGVAARAEGTHPLPTIAAEFDTRGILMIASRAFHGKLLSEEDGIKIRNQIFLPLLATVKADSCIARVLNSIH